MTNAASQIESPVPEAPIVKYEVSVDQIRAWGEQYAGLEATTREGYEAVRGAIATLRTTRVGVERRRVELKASALEYGRRVDAVAKQLTTELEAIEEPLKAKKAVIDDERERVKREKEAAEKAKVEAEIRAKREAEEARLRAEREAEEARLAVEREAQRVEAERLAAERAAIAKEREAAEAARREAEERAEAERREVDAKARAEREAEESRLAEQRAQLDREREELERARREAERQEELRQARIRAEEDAKAAAERARIDAEEERVREAERQAELARRLEALKPDAVKLAQYANALHAVPLPDVSTPEAVAALDRAQAMLQQACAALDAPGERIEASEAGQRVIDPGTPEDFA